MANTSRERVTKMKMLPSRSLAAQSFYHIRTVQMEEKVVGEEDVDGLQQLEHEQIFEETDDDGIIYEYEMVNPKQMPNVVRPITHRPIFAEEQRPFGTNYYKQQQVQQINHPGATEQFLEEYKYKDEEGGAYSFRPAAGSIAYEDASYAVKNQYQTEVPRRGRPPANRRIKPPVHLEMTAELTPYSSDYVPPTVSTRRNTNTVGGQMGANFRGYKRGPLSDAVIDGMGMPTPYDPNAPLRLKLDPAKAFTKSNCSKIIKAYLRAEGVNVPSSKRTGHQDVKEETVHLNRTLVELPLGDPNEEKWPLFASNHWQRTDLTKLLLRFLRAPQTFPHARVCTTMPTEYYGRRGLYIINLNQGEPVRVRDLPVDSYGNWGKGLYSGAVRYKRMPNGHYVRVPKDMLPPDERRRRYRRKPVEPEIDVSEEPTEEQQPYSPSVNNRALQHLTPAQLIAAAADKDAQKPWDCKLHYASYVNPRAPEFTKVIARVQLTKADVQDSVVLLYFNWGCDPYQFEPKPYGPWAYRKSVQTLKMPEPSRDTRKRTFRVSSNVTLSGQPMKRRGRPPKNETLSEPMKRVERPPKNFKVTLRGDEQLNTEEEDGSLSWCDVNREPPKPTVVTRSVVRQKELLQDQEVVKEEEDEHDDVSDDDDAFVSLPPVVRRRVSTNQKQELRPFPTDVVAGDGANELGEGFRVNEKKDADLLQMFEQCVTRLKGGGELNTTQKERTQLLGTIQKLATGEPPVKRGRGRPRKHL